MKKVLLTLTLTSMTAFAAGNASGGLFNPIERGGGGNTGGRDTGGGYGTTIVDAADGTLNKLEAMGRVVNPMVNTNSPLGVAPVKSGFTTGDDESPINAKKLRDFAHTKGNLNVGDFGGVPAFINDGKIYFDQTVWAQKLADGGFEREMLQLLVQAQATSREAGGLADGPSGLEK